MIIKSIYETSYPGMYKVEPVEGTSFFIRKDYLLKTDFSLLEAGVELSDEEADNLLDAGLTCVVELKAVEYLARCEQSRFGLTQKLIKKDFEKKYIEKALSYLEKAEYLSDLRFSRAWLHSRSLNHYEGRIRLINELMSRGISKETSQKAVLEFFEENDEYELCRKDTEKQKKRGKQDEKLIAALMNDGFSYKIIKEVLAE
jgi:regulatory protein